MKKVLVFAGTRPEAIKMAPVVMQLKKYPEKFAVHLCATGQHEEMLRHSFADFSLTPDSFLNVMSQGQNLAGLTSRLFAALDITLEEYKPDIILVQGDTTSVLVASLCAFYRRIPVGHVEAGLRTGRMDNPFPEEMNRRVAGLVASWHFAPTNLARENLLKNSVAESSILVTGNTVVDALLFTCKQIEAAPPVLSARCEKLVESGQPYILVTSHRRENFGEGIHNTCKALLELMKIRPDIAVVWPVHLNPQVRQPVMQLLQGVPNLYLEPPLPYRSFVRVMRSCKLILSDSGGIQEEGPSLGKYVLIMRETTERSEGIDAGVNKLVGTHPETIVAETLAALQKQSQSDNMSLLPNPYGDGLAAVRIVDFLGTVAINS